MPMDKSRYPADWTEIAHEVKNNADWCCEHCGKPCFKPGELIPDLIERISPDWQAQMIDEENGEPVFRPQRFQLGTAHLDQNPSNNQPSNLAALCTACHLRHDAQYRQANATAKQERAGQLPLMGAPAIAPMPAGNGQDPNRIQRGLW